MAEVVNTPQASFQPMPDLSPEQYAALKADIEKNGIIVPIVVDQDGRVLDGHNRKQIGGELGIEVPTEVRKVRDDEEAADLAVTLNCARRHLTREQVRNVIASEIHRRPEDSDRAIAKRVGCSPTTVGTVRRPSGVSNLDTPRLATREEAEESTRKIQESLRGAHETLAGLVTIGLANGIPVNDMVRALFAGQRSMEESYRGREHGEDLSLTFRRGVWEPVIEMTLRPDLPIWTEGEMAWSDESSRELLEAIAGPLDKPVTR